MVEEVRKVMLDMAYKVKISSVHNMLIYYLNSFPFAEEELMMSPTRTFAGKASPINDKGKSLAIPIPKKRKATASKKLLV